MGLWWEDVDLENRTLRIQRQFCRAGGLKSRAGLPTRRCRGWPQSDSGLEAGVGDPRPGYVFGLDKPFDVNAPNHYLTRLIQTIRLDHPDFPTLRVHDLRHTAP